MSFITQTGGATTPGRGLESIQKARCQKYLQWEIRGLKTTQGIPRLAKMRILIHLRKLESNLQIEIRMR